MSQQREIIPLFPLDRVLFPNMVLPLHIYEERYKEMISVCMENRSVFGVLRHSPDNPTKIGTTARIQRILHTYADGRMDILVHGEDRFGLILPLEDREYLRGKVALFFDDTDFPATHNNVDEMIELYRHFLKRLGLEDTHRRQLEQIVDRSLEEQSISYIIGQTIGLNLTAQMDLLSETVPQVRVQTLLTQLRKMETIHHLASDLFEGGSFDPTMN